MKHGKQLLVIATFALSLLSCKKELKQGSADELSSSRALGNIDLNSDGAGYVFTLSNEAVGNRVLVYSRNSAGKINSVGSFPTGGFGTGVGLGSQGAIVLSQDNNFLLAVNAGSNSITSFAVTGASLEWKSTVASGGETPISVTIHDDLVYVLNAGGTGNISGFRLHEDGTLHSIEGSTKPLSSASAAPAQVSFLADGTVLVITEKAENKIITYTVDETGKPAVFHSINSSTPTPFGFAVSRQGDIYVSEAAGGNPGASALSSYHVNGDGTIQLVDGSVAAGQTAACWVALSNNGKFVFDSNTGSSNVSSYTTDKGDLTLQEASAGLTGTGSAPIDASLSTDSRFLYVLTARTNTIAVFQVSAGGSLTQLQIVPGIPAGSSGIASK